MDLKVQLSRIAILAIILIVWQLAPTYHIISPYVLAPLSRVISSLPELNNPSNIYVPGGIIANLLLTLREIALGFALSIAIGLVIGFLIGYYRTAGEAYEPIVYVVHAVPAVILYPILYLTLGFGLDSKVIFAVLLGAFPLIINTAAGIRQIKRDYIRMAKSLGATDTQIFSQVILPAAGPNIMSGLRLSLGAVVIGVIAAEILASRAGLGRVIDNLSNGLRLGQMYATISIVVLVAFGLYLLILIVEKRVLAYERH